MPTLDAYLARVTSEHNQKPNYLAVLTAVLQPFVEVQETLSALSYAFDLDLAVGVQLDAVGVRVGRTRYLPVPIDVYFSFDIANFGWDQGAWKGPFDPDTGLTKLADDQYRILLRAVIAANQWDGTIPGAYTAWEVLFAGTPYSIILQDNRDLSMDMVLLGPIPDAITKALFTIGELDLKPAGVKLRHNLPTVYPAGPGGTPLFGFDVQNSTMSGWDSGAWTQMISEE